LNIYCRYFSTPRERDKKRRKVDNQINKSINIEIKQELSHIICVKDVNIYGNLKNINDVRKWC
jgi:hypothetical protein